MIRPASYGPRSVTTQEVVAPFSRLRTDTTVPFGSVLWAHSPARQSYQEAPPCSVAGGAVVVVVVDVEVDVEVEVDAGAFTATFAGAFATPVTGVGSGTAATASVVTVVGGAVVVGAVVVVVTDTKGASVLTDAALASVLGMLSITRIGNANTVNQTANTRRCRGTTYGCRTSASLASRVSVLFSLVVAVLLCSERSYGGP